MYRLYWCVRAPTVRVGWQHASQMCTTFFAHCLHIGWFISCKIDSIDHHNCLTVCYRNDVQLDMTWLQFFFRLHSLLRLNTYNFTINLFDMVFRFSFYFNVSCWIAIRKNELQISRVIKITASTYCITI